MKKITATSVMPYVQLMRMHKPIGSFLLLWPTLWALWIASHGAPPLFILLIFVLGVVAMRSAGCVINDIADRHFDGAVERTANRPLVIGTITVKAAVILFLGLCVLSLLLVLQLNRFAIYLSFIALALAMIYPFTKRYTYLPQLVLGAAFAWAVPMSFAAITNHISVIGWLLFLVAMIWPVAYDSIYALMDKQDDLKVGIKSTAILFGRWDIRIIFCLQLFFLALMSSIGLLIQARIYYYLALIVAFIMIGYQIMLLTKRSTDNYYRAFQNNLWVGAVIFLGVFLNYFNVY